MLKSFLLAIVSTTVLVNAVANNSQLFYLKTDLKYNEPEKAQFKDLWMYSYHTGAGASDATFAANKTDYAVQGFINYTGNGVGLLTFSVGPIYPWTMAADSSSYRTWSPMTINGFSGGSNGFFINETGLQWNTDYMDGTNTTFSGFMGWLVCNWWHDNTPQLFWREPYGKAATPCNCADVYLCPEFI